MANMSLSEQITYSTVLIQCKYNDGTSGTGTGFVINLCKKNNAHVPVIMTNKHVVKDSLLSQFEFCVRDETGHLKDKKSINIVVNKPLWIDHPDENIDLSLLPLADILNYIGDKSVKPFYIALETNLIPSNDLIDEFAAMEDIVMVGYPIGLSDTYNHKPILRKGTTATHMKHDYKGKKEYLIDMACFPGSSGSPVFILNEGTYKTAGFSMSMPGRIHLIGVLYAGPQFSATGSITLSNLPNIPTPIINIPVNIGVVIKSSEILVFEKWLLDNVINKNEGNT